LNLNASEFGFEDMFGAYDVFVADRWNGRKLPDNYTMELDA
jgi:hypothetical protein